MPVKISIEGGNVTSVTDALGNAIQIGNDSVGRPTSIVNALGKVTQISYNLGDLSAVTDPLGRTVSIFTDAVGRVTGVSDPLGHVTRYSYDAVDDVVQVTDPKGGVTSLSYDPNRNLLSVEGPRNVGAYSFGYDSRNRVHTYTDPLGQTATYNYDGMGNLTSKVDRKNQTTSYAYDGLNRLQTVTYADTSTITVTWDAGNRPTQIADTADGIVTRQYDGLDRLTQEMSPQGQVDYQYDAASRRTQLTVSGLSAVGYQYDSANRLTQVAQGAATVGLSYDAADRRKVVTLPNGVTESYSYDDSDELTGINYDHGTTHLGELTYGYDQAGRRVSESGSLASLLTPSTVSSATYDGDNRLTNWNGIPLTYDANGNMSTYGSSSYTWNPRDQLIGTSDGAGSFSYDAFGRRTSQTATGVTVPYLYDGANPATISGYMLLNGLGIDERFAETSAAGTSSYLSDALGSTVGVTDASGAMVGGSTYSPYGATSFTGSVTTPFEFTGRENDGATNLYYYRARYYNSDLGRFISADPLGFGGGMNFYAYVNGNPISYRDPKGEDAWTYYVSWINFVNYVGNLNADVFAFVAAEGSYPPGSPVRAGGEAVGLLGYSTQRGEYLSGILTTGAIYGGPNVYYGDLGGVEWTLGCGGVQQQAVEFQDLSLGPVGAGGYTAGPETGQFMYGGAGFLGEHLVLGMGWGAGPPSQNYIQPWGGAW